MLRYGYFCCMTKWQVFVAYRSFFFFFFFFLNFFCCLYKLICSPHTTSFHWTCYILFVVVTMLCNDIIMLIWGDIVTHSSVFVWFVVNIISMHSTSNKDSCSLSSLIFLCPVCLSLSHFNSLWPSDAIWYPRTCTGPVFCDWAWFQPMREDVTYVSNDSSHWLMPCLAIDKNLNRSRSSAQIMVCWAFSTILSLELM